MSDRQPANALSASFASGLAGGELNIRHSQMPRDRTDTPKLPTQRPRQMAVDGGGSSKTRSPLPAKLVVRCGGVRVNGARDHQDLPPARSQQGDTLTFAAGAVQMRSVQLLRHRPTRPVTGRPGPCEGSKLLYTDLSPGRPLMARRPPVVVGSARCRPRSHRRNMERVCGTMPEA